MLYASIVLLPVALYGYLSTSKSKKVVVASAASPGDQLREKSASVGRELLSALFLGSTLAFGVAIIIFLGGIVVDYKESRGIFAVVLPGETLPPAPAYSFPPAPVSDKEPAAEGESDSDTSDSKTSNELTDK